MKKTIISALCLAIIVIFLGFGLRADVPGPDTENLWKQKALEWKAKFLTMRDLKNAWKERSDNWHGKYLDMRDLKNVRKEQSNHWKAKYQDCKEEPQPDPTPDKKLTVRNGKILYGGKPIKLCGVSRWEALWRAGKMPGYDKTWGDYSLEWYEQQLIDSGINYVRHAGIKNTQFLYDHCKRMKKAGIIVEITVFRSKKNSKGVLVRLEDMGELARLGNVFFDVNNEFLDGPDASINEAIRIARILKRQGCLISGGAWSGTKGKAQSDEFHSKYDGLDINSHHRNWGETSFKKDVRKGKPVVFNEFFAMRSGMTLAKTKQLMNLAFDCGVQGVQYYGWRDKKLNLPGLTVFDPFDYREMLQYAGKLAKEINV